MSGKWLCEPPAWPVAPRPFVVEPVGGWLGRVAARYRMSVDELAQMYGLELAFDRTVNAWLQVSRIGQATLDKLAALARVNSLDIDALQRPQAQWGPLSHLAYCPTCVFLNPLDVTSPCWKRDWLDPTSTGCPIHTRVLERLPIGSVRMCGNFDHLLHIVSRREARRRRRP